MLLKSLSKRLFSHFKHPIRFCSQLNMARPEEKPQNPQTGKLRKFTLDKSYHGIKTDAGWQKRIIERERENYKDWKKMTNSHFQKWKRQIYKRTESQVKPLPEQYGDYFYFTETKRFKGRPYEVFFRQNVKTGERAKVLDLKEITKIHDPSLVSFDKLKMSDDHSKVAFTVDLHNNEKLSTGIVDVEHGTLIDWIEHACQAEFDQSGQGVFYCVADKHNRPFKVLKRAIGEKQVDEVVYEDNDPTHYVEIGVSKDKKYFIFTDGHGATTVLDRQGGSGELIEISPSGEGTKMFLDHIRDYFVLLTNHLSQNQVQIFKLYDKDIKLGPSAWQKVPLPVKNYIIEDIDCFHDFIAVYLRQWSDDGPISTSNISILSTISEGSAQPEVKLLDIEEGVGEITPAINQNYHSSKLRFTFTSPIIYENLYEYDHETKETELLQSMQLTGPEIVRNNFILEQVEAASHDGEAVPMTIFRKAGAPLDRSSKCLIQGYGAYGLNMDMGFNIANINAVEQGWVVATAHVRGGMEKGIQWHNDGKLEKKINSIYDFISCSQYLIANRYTHPNLLAAKGESAGGMLVAQALNLHPELYRAAILKVPFLDVLNTLEDTSLQLTETDYLELGNPFEDEEIFKQMLSYSPFENIHSTEYPAIYLDISLDDPRVASWGSLKYLEKLRDLAKTPLRIPDFGNKNIVANITSDEGHFGSAVNQENLDKLVMEYAWLDFLMFEKDMK